PVAVEGGHDPRLPEHPVNPADRAVELGGSFQIADEEVRVPQAPGRQADAQMFGRVLAHCVLHSRVMSICWRLSIRPVGPNETSAARMELTPMSYYRQFGAKEGQ